MSFVRFTAKIESGLFMFDVEASIHDDGDILIEKVYFSGCAQPLHFTQEDHFVKIYGESDIIDEIRTQYLREAELDGMMKDVEDFERGDA